MLIGYTNAAVLAHAVAALNEKKIKKRLSRLGGSETIWKLRLECLWLETSTQTRLGRATSDSRSTEDNSIQASADGYSSFNAVNWIGDSDLERDQSSTSSTAICAHFHRARGDPFDITIASHPLAQCTGYLPEYSLMRPLELLRLSGNSERINRPHRQGP